MENLIHSPALQHLPLLEILIRLLLLFLLPFVGGLLLSIVASLLLRTHHPPVSRDLLGLFAGQPALYVICAIVPLLTLGVLYRQLLFDTPIPVAAYLFRLCGLSVAAWGVILLYRRTHHPAAGTLGALLLTGLSFHLISTLVLTRVPEKWALLEGPVPFIFTIQVVIRFAAFLAASLVFMGGSVVLFTLRWPGSSEGDRPWRRGLGLGSTLGGALLLPPLLLWDHYTAPHLELAGSTLARGIMVLAVLFLIALFAFDMIQRRHERFAWPLFILSLLLFALWADREVGAQGIVNREHAHLLHEQAKRTQEEWTAEREALYASAQPVDAALGERIYRERCTACHAIDQRVVGPAYRDVLPKYENDPDGLEAFIRNPTKIDPDYPAMPNQGLRRGEVKAVVLYLMGLLTEKEEEEP